MVHYFIDISTAESGRVWQEVDLSLIEHTETRIEFGHKQLYYDGKRVYAGNPKADKYFRNVFTGEIRWLTRNETKTK